MARTAYFGTATIEDLVATGKVLAVASLIANIADTLQTVATEFLDANKTFTLIVVSTRNRSLIRKYQRGSTWRDPVFPTIDCAGHHHNTVVLVQFVVEKIE
jgi:hypothetical protein